MEQTAAAKWPLVLLGCCTCLAGMFAGALFGGSALISSIQFNISDFSQEKAAELFLDNRIRPFS